jgi:glucose dehydrogenase
MGLCGRMVSVVPSMFLCAALTCFGQASGSGQASGDWPMYGHDGGSTRFSPLTQVNVDNVSKLKRAWTFHMTPATPAAAAAPANGAAPAGPARARGRRSEATPLMVDGVIYLPTPFSRVVALDASTGKQIWEYQLSNNDNAATRGVAYWPGDGKKLGPRIVFGTAAGSLIALDAKTGKLSAGFGTDGIVDFKEGVANGFKTQVGMSSPPSIYKNVIITGVRVQEQPALGPAGDTRGWDVVTGKLLWTFHSVPHPGEQGIETWETPDSWKNRSGTNAWGFLSVDTETGTVFVPLGAATQDEYGGDRKGANLYSQTLVALDAQTGKQKWHFQVIHHDTWDFDFGGAPILANVHRGSETIPVVVQTNKTGLVWILDRRDGTPIYGAEERPIPASDVPGEDSWNTEPFPLKPAPLSRMSFKKEELANVAPEHTKACEDLFTKFPTTHNDGPFTRYGLQPSIVFPGTWGGANWQGGTYDPKLNYVFYNVNDYADYGQMVPTAPGSQVPYERSGPIGGHYGRFADSKTGWPCQQPPWGELVALNLDTGEYVWREPFGTIPELEAKGIKNTGSLNMGGAITTAGGLLFIAATPDLHFRAFDEKTGKMLWDTTLEAAGGDTPITYRGKDGKQYIVIVATGGAFGQGSGDVVAAYALP